MNQHIRNIRSITAKQWRTAIFYGTLKAVVFVAIAVTVSIVFGNMVDAPEWAMAFLATVLAFQFLVIFKEPWGNYEPTN